MINTEIDWLEVRLDTLYNYVDYFIIVESGKTFTGLDKPLVVKENLGRFAAYNDKIVYHELQYPPDFDSVPRSMGQGGLPERCHVHPGLPQTHRRFGAGAGRRHDSRRRRRDSPA